MEGPSVVVYHTVKTVNGDGAVGMYQCQYQCTHIHRSYGQALTLGEVSCQGLYVHKGLLASIKKVKQ